MDSVKTLACYYLGLRVITYSSLRNDELVYAFDEDRLFLGKAIMKLNSEEIADAESRMEVYLKINIVIALQA